MEGISNQHKGLRFGTINFSDYQGVEVLGYKKADVLGQELENSTRKDLVNEIEDAQGGPMVYKDGDVLGQELENSTRKDLVNEIEDAQGGPMVYKDGDHWKQNYQLRHEVNNCFYFVNYGWCMYGSNCRFNHPYNQLVQGCLNETVVASVSDFNFSGLRVPQGAKECPHYRQNGSCQYGLNCWFDHSEPSSLEGGFLHSGYTGLEDTMQCSWSFTAPVNEIGLCNPYMYQQEQIIPSSEWSGNQGPNKEWSPSSPTTFSMKTAAAVAKPFEPNQARLLTIGSPKPEEQPEGSLNFGFGFRNPKVSSCILNDRGLPLRSDTEVCAFYGGYGVCKEGPACRFNHPANLPKQVPRAGSDEAEVLSAGSPEAQAPPAGSQEAHPPQLSHPPTQDKN